MENQSVHIVAEPGRSLAAFAFRLYKAGAAQALPGGLSLTEHAMTGASLYVVAGLPAGSPGDDYALTWVAQGTRGFEAWRQPADLTRITLPLRTDGVAVGDLDLLLTVGGASLPTAGLTLSPIGPSPTDYLLSNLPQPAAGQQASVAVGADAFYQVFHWPTVAFPGTTSRAPAVVEQEVEIGYLRDKWKRSALTAYPQGVEVPDPGHGHDEVSPVRYVGQPFDINQAAHIAPFTADEVAGPKGTGYLLCLLRPFRPPVVMTPGARPEMAEQVMLEVQVVTPGNRGPAVANLYAGVLAMLFRYVSFRPGEAGISIIRNLEPPPERPAYLGDDGTWRYDQLEIPLTRFYRAQPAGAQ